MGRVADAQQAGLPPGVEAVHRHAQQLHVVPATDFVHAPGKRRRGTRDGLAECIEPARPQGIDATLGDDVGALPIVVAVDHGQEVAGVDEAAALVVVRGRLRQAHPQHVDGRTDVAHPQPRRIAQHGAAPVAGHDEVGPDAQLAVGVTGLHPHDTAFFLDHARALRAQQQAKARAALGLVAQEVEELPLRHERDEAAGHRAQALEVGQAHTLAGDGGMQTAHLVVRTRQEGVKQPQVGHDLQGRRMDGVAPEVAQEVGVLLEHRHVDAGTHEQQREHQPGRAAADDAAAGVEASDGRGHGAPSTGVSQEYAA